MTGFRAPLVSGVAGGVGATSLALALHGRDAGVAARGADIVVCRSSAESLDRAVRIADLLDPTAPRPVLAVTLDGADRRTPERLAELGPGWSAVVLVPHVSRWRGIVDPYREAAGLLGTPREILPRALRPYLESVTKLARAVADSGRLGRPAPRTGTFPAVVGPRGTATRAALPLARAGALVPTAGLAGPEPGPPPSGRTTLPAPGGLLPAGPTSSGSGVALSGHTAVPIPLARPDPLFAAHRPFVPLVGEPATASPPADHPELRPVRGIRLVAVEPVERA